MKSKRKVQAGSRVLFVDFDGVLSPGPATSPGGPAVNATHFQWVPTLVRLLDPHPDVAVVVHSSWRAHYDDDELGELLGDLKGRLLGATPRHLPRHASILACLDSGLARLGYRILDDDLAEFPSPPPSELIVCDPATGVSGTRVMAELRIWLEATSVSNWR